MGWKGALLLFRIALHALPLSERLQPCQPSDLIQRIFLKRRAECFKYSQRFFRPLVKGAVACKHIALPAEQPFFVNAILLADMPDQQFFGLNPAVFQVADHITAYAEPIAKLPLRQSESCPNSLDTLFQRIRPLFIILEFVTAGAQISDSMFSDALESDVFLEIHKVKESAAKEFDALFRSLDEQRQQEVLQMLRRLSMAKAMEPDPEAALTSV